MANFLPRTCARHTWLHWILWYIQTWGRWGLDVRIKIPKANSRAAEVSPRHTKPSGIFLKPKRGYNQLWLGDCRSVGQILGIGTPHPLKFAQTAAWCDNTPMVSWDNKWSSSKSMVAARLVWALALWLHTNQASPLITWSITGILNIMANTASQTFNQHFYNWWWYILTPFQFLLSSPTGNILDALPIWWQAKYSDLFRATRADIDAGVMAANSYERKQYLNHWKWFIDPLHNMDSMITWTDSKQDLSDGIRISLLGAFAKWVRTGEYTRDGQIVKCQRVATSHIKCHLSDIRTGWNI